MMSETQRQTAIPSSIPVLIVGGGPTGLMASILLGRFGVPNLLVEKHPSTSLFPKARRLRTRTMEITADGAHSFVRRAAGIGMSADDHLTSELNIPFRADLGPLRGTNRSVLFRVDNDAVGGIIGMAGEGRWNFLCPEFPDATPERCAEVVRAAAGVPDLLVEIVAISRWERAAAVAHRFRAGRVFLAGDAGALLHHGPLPREESILLANCRTSQRRGGIGAPPQLGACHVPASPSYRSRPRGDHACRPRRLPQGQPLHADAR